MSSPVLLVLGAEPDNLDTDLDHDPPNEETSLLQGNSRSRDVPPSPARHRHYVWVVSILLCGACLIEIGDMMLRAPLTRVLENVLCQQYYNSTAPMGTQITLPIPEEDCKMPEVQDALAMLLGWDSTISCIPGLFLALPCGYMADRYGRKIVLLVCLMGLLLKLLWIQIIVRLDTFLDVRWLWFGNVFICIGGGSAVLQGTLYAIFADVTPEDKRAAVFFQLMATLMISTLVGVPAAWYLMKSSSLLAMEVSLGFVGAGTFLVFFLPETLKQAKLLEASSHGLAGDVVPEEDSSQPLKIPSILDVIKESNFVFESPTLCALGITCVVGPILSYSTDQLVQLASKRYHWSIADASFVTPLTSISTFVVLVLLLPLTYWILGSKLGFRPTTKDLIVARWSLIFLVLGCLLIAIASSPQILILGQVTLSLGMGYMPAVRSLATSFVHADQVSRLYAVIAVIQTVGSMLAGPLIAGAFSWGVDLGGAWIGMAFIATAGIVLVLGLPVWIIRPPKPEDDVHD